MDKDIEPEPEKNFVIKSLKDAEILINEAINSHDNNLFNTTLDKCEGVFDTACVMALCARGISTFSGLYREARFNNRVQKVI